MRHSFTPKREFTSDAERGPVARRVFKIVAVIGVLGYAELGWLAWSAITTGKSARQCFFEFFCYTPLYAAMVYRVVRDAWRGVPESETILALSLWGLPILVGLWVAYCLFLA